MFRWPSFFSRVPQTTKLHLGCGPRLLENWINVDITRRPGVVAWDLTKPFPLKSRSIELIYSEHFIEHLTRPDALGMLRECRRVLSPAGRLRLSTPNLKKLVEEYVAGRLTEWTDMGWRPATPCALLNEGLRLWGHQFVYDEAELETLLKEAGFRNVTVCPWGQSAWPGLSNLESRPLHGEIIMEAGQT